MKLSPYLIAVVTGMFAIAAEAANEPYAGAIVHQNNSLKPQADFRPGNMTDIMPVFGEKNKKEKDQEIYFSADELETDEANSTIIAKGSVEVIRDKLTLHADRLWYDQKHDKVVAEGNVVVKDVDGSVLYTDRIMLTDKMNRAEVNKVKVIMRDESRIWADSFLKKRNNNKQMRHASYTACDMCEGKSPLWQIDARKVSYDAAGQNVNYNDAVLRVKDVPIFYTPFLSHPSPEVKRRSGFLMASIGSSSYLGKYLQPTYFWNVSDQTDVILSPYFTTDRDVVLNGQFHHYFYKGHLNAEGSFLKDNGEYKKAEYKKYNRPEHRGNLFLDARYEINDYWVSHLDLNYVSDVFYLKDLSLPKEDDAWLTSKLSFERFEGRNYAAIEGYYYQLTSLNLKNSDSNAYKRMKDLPYVAPFMEYEHITTPDKYGSYIKTNLSEASVYSDNDEESHRLTMINSWELPYISDYGEQYKFVASLKSDAFYVSDYKYKQNDTYNGTLAQAFPQLGVEWRLPLVRATEDTRQIIEPVIVATFAPDKENHPYKIPNKDSHDLEFDDSNILSLDRYAGYDRNDTGSRVSYGLNWSSYGDIMGHTSAFIAQSYQLSKDSTFMEAIDGEDDRKFSDYVGRVYATPNDYLDLNYRFRLDKSDYEIEYSELGATVGADILQFYASYIYLRPGNDYYYYDTGARKELYFSVKSEVTKNWSVSIFDRIDLTDNGGQLEQGGQVAYEDECLQLAFVAKKNFYDDPTLDNGYEFGITFFLKTLGGFGSK